MRGGARWEFRARTPEALRAMETFSVFSDPDDVTSLR